MSSQDETYLFVTPEFTRFLADNDIGLSDLLRQAGLDAEVRLGKDPATDDAGHKEPATIILASAALIAAATPLLREVIRNLTGRESVVRERRLIPAEDSKGNIVYNAKGVPIVHWVDVVKGQAPDNGIQTVKITGFGIEISLRGK
jgi:hypothetical protein